MWRRQNEITKSVIKRIKNIAISVYFLLFARCFEKLLNHWIVWQIVMEIGCAIIEFNDYTSNHNIGMKREGKKNKTLLCGIPELFP